MSVCSQFDYVAPKWPNKSVIADSRTVKPVKNRKRQQKIVKKKKKNEYTIMFKTKACKGITLSL